MPRLSMGIIYGLTAALCWGTADFLVTRVARQIGAVQTLFYIQLVGLLMLGGPLLIWPAIPHSTPGAWALIFGISLINLVGTLLLYRAFEIGTLSVVSPVASGFAVVTALLALASGERPALLALFGALLLIVGVVVVSRARHSTQPATLAGLPEALGVVLCFGVYFWAVDYVTPSLGVVWPVLVTRAVEMAGIRLLLFSQGRAVARLSHRIWALVLGGALLDTLAFLAFNLGVNNAHTAIVTALASLFSAVTVLLAWIFLRERLSPAQWAGVGVIMAGVLLVSL